MTASWIAGADARPGLDAAAGGYLGIDIGGSKVVLRLEAEGLPPHEAGFGWPQSTDAAADLDILLREVHRLQESRSVPIGRVGVAMPAMLDETGRVVAWPGRPSWAGVNPRAALRRLLPQTETFWADDGDLAAIAEADAAGCDDLMYLGVGTGVGGGIVLRGRSPLGPRNASCEIGHLIVEGAGPLCSCGRRGCVQAVSSGPATLRRAAQLRGRTVTFVELRRAWLDGDEWAVAAIKESCDTLARAVVGVCELLDPQRAVVGGGFAEGLPGFVTEIRTRVEALARPGRSAVPVLPALCGALSSLRGAVLLARHAPGWDLSDPGVTR